MKNTKKITISAMLVALGTMFMVVGAVIEVMDLTAVVFASLLVAFAYIELGSPYTYLVWLCTSLATFLLYPYSLMWLMYLLIFGVYPILKGFIEKLPKALWLIVKLVFANVTFTLLVLGTEFIIGVSFFEQEKLFGLPPLAVKAIIWVMMNVMFVLYDYFINVMVRYYFVKLTNCQLSIF